MSKRNVIVKLTKEFPEDSHLWSIDINLVSGRFNRAEVEGIPQSFERLSTVRSVTHGRLTGFSMWPEDGGDEDQFKREVLDTAKELFAVKRVLEPEEEEE